MKIKKILAGVLGISLILLLLIFVNSWVGNPISNLIAKNVAKKYAAENYSDLNLHIESSIYNFKFDSYIVQLQSTTSKDTKFSVYVDNFGKVLRDDYEYEVENNFSTWRRLEDELRHIGDDLFGKNLQYEVAHAIITFIDSKNEELAKLKKDMELDIYNPPLPISASVTIIDEDVSYEKMAEVMKAMEAVCKSEKIPITQYSVRIEYITTTIDDKGVEAKDNQFISLYNVPAKILDSEDLPATLEKFESK